METSTSSEKRGQARTLVLVLALVAILILGSAFRFYNVNWDEDTYHIHPDERHTTMVVTAIQWPESLVEYLDTSHSSLNPRNNNTVYFYGTLPLFLTKYVATQAETLVGSVLDAQTEAAEAAPARLRLTSYDRIHLVGRVLSALFDLGSVLLLFFLARRLFDWRVGLIASLLLALTALNIQGSHYFTVDTFLTFFVALTIWFTLDVAEGKGWPSYVGLGLSMGFTLASKVSVFLLVAVVALGAWVWVRRQALAGQPVGRSLMRAFWGLVLAAGISLLIFRLAQPYAWAGPNYDGWDTVPQPWGERVRVFEKVPAPVRALVMPNPQWIADISSAGAQQTGKADLPWGRQWTERTPWLYPLENMVLWGLGLPLGVAAWLGVGLVVVQLVLRVWKRRRAISETPDAEPSVASPSSSVVRRPSSALLRNWDLLLIPLAWVLLTFVWQGMQYVKSIRYFMPIYPYLAMFAAYLVVSAWDWASSLSRGKGRGVARILAGGLGAFVLVGTLAWAWAFVQIYREPVTRVQASRWIYENVEAGATLHYRTAAGESGQLQVALPSRHVYGANGQWLATPFTPPHDLVATEVVLNDLSGLEGPSEGAFEVQIVTTDLDTQQLAGVQIEATFGGEGGRRHAFALPDLPLEGEQTYLFQTRAVRGAPLVAEAATIANEHFDDSLPFNLDGHVAYGMYQGQDLALYNEDTPAKLEELLDALDNADYISMSSGRLWQSIPRLPMRYPVTTRYYELLFAEELGFVKAAEYHSYPRLFGIEFDDTWAEEQFTVYDHPKVLIYRKTEAYDRAQVRAMLSEGVDWTSIPAWLNPRDVPEWRREQVRKQDQEEQGNMMLTEEQRLVQEQGGTWASLFDRNSLPNRWPTLSWLVLLALVGLAALPITLLVCQWLPDRGYILSRVVGVLLLAWLSWMLTNLTPLHYSRGTILLALGLLVLFSWGSLLLPGQRRRLGDLWRTQKRSVLVGEILFLVFFGVFLLVRMGNPDLWHPYKGGEKPMDFAYLNAVIKSTEFPPYDPWFAGGYLNYYYFGQVIVGTLIKLVGIVPAVAYNLVIPSWFAMTAMGAFSLTFNLVARRSSGEVDGSAAPQGRAELGLGDPSARRSAGEAEESSVSSSALNPYLFGLVGALFVSVLGNLGQIVLLLGKLGEGMAGTFDSTIPGLAGLVRLAAGLFAVVFGGRTMPIAIDEWYWNASRAIPQGPGEAIITEFPFFTFLYGDLHAHLIALPLALLSLAFALALVKEAESTEGIERPAWTSLAARLLVLVLWSLTLGAIRTTNSWDVPGHLLLVLGALVIAEYTRRGRVTWRLVWAVTWQLGLVFVLSWWLLYWPFWASYGSFYDNVGLWQGTRTPLWAYFVVHGLFLFIVVSYLLARVVGDRSKGPLWRRLRLTLRYRSRGKRLGAAARFVGVRCLPLGAWFWVVIALLVLLEIFFLVPGLISFTQAHPDAGEGVYAYRGLSVLALGLPLAVLGLLLFFRPGLSPTKRLWTYMVLMALAMSLGVEVIVVEGDIARMNTVFKFYLQVWLIWAVAAAAALAWMLARVGRWKWGRGVWLAILSVLLFFAILYPPLATAAKVRDRFDTDLKAGLDGWAYMETANYWDPSSVNYDLKWDYEAMRWLLDHVVGSPVILEGHTPEYRWGGRYSINTGLPAVLGWNWHQRQQRAAGDQQDIWDRADDIATIYNEPLPALVTPLLDQYNVRYIVVGPLERAYYLDTGLAKFEPMAVDGLLRVVFDNGVVTIYEVVY